jgi:hypothetical protein
MRIPLYAALICLAIFCHGGVAWATVGFGEMGKTRVEWIIQGRVAVVFKTVPTPTLDLVEAREAGFMETGFNGILPMRDLAHDIVSVGIDGDCLIAVDSRNVVYGFDLAESADLGRKSLIGHGMAPVLPVKEFLVARSKQENWNRTYQLCGTGAAVLILGGAVVVWRVQRSRSRARPSA